MKAPLSSLHNCNKPISPPARTNWLSAEIATDLSEYEGWLHRHHLALGVRDGTEVTLPPYGPCVLIAGPSALATVMLMASRQPESLWTLVAALTVTMLFAALVLVLGDRLQQWLGERAMQAIERLMGLVLTAMAVEMLLDGIRMFVQGLE